MSDSDVLLTSALNYYLREKYFHHVLELAEDGLKKFVNDPALQMFRAISLMMQGKYNEASRQFEEAQDNPEFALASTVALIHVHKLSKTVDKEAVQDFENKLREERKTANDKANYSASLVYFYTEKYDKAKELIDKSLKSSPQNADFMCLKGFIEMFMGKDIKVAIQTFDDVQQIVGQQKYPDVYLGKGKYNEIRQNFNFSLDSLNQGVALTPNFLPLHIEKMKVHLMLRAWDQCMETAQKCHIIEPRCIPAFQYIIMNAICYDGQYNEAASLLTDLLLGLDKEEPENATLYADCGRLYSRVCGRHAGILQQTKIFLDKASTIAKSDAEIQSELANQYRLMGQNKQALKIHKQTIQMEAASSTSLLGVVHCQLLENELAEAEAQVELIKAVHQENITKSTEMKYLEILIAKQKDVNAGEIKSKLIHLINSHLESLKKITYGPQYFCQLNPDFVLEVVNELFRFAPIEPAKSAHVADTILKEIITILSFLTDAVPGLVDGLYLTGKAKYLSGEIDSAQNVLQQCLNKDQTFSEAHLLLAQIYLQKQQFKLASQSLEVGLSFNFEVRDHPIYHLIKARILKKSNNVQGSIPLLQNAMSMPKFKKSADAASANVPKKQSRLEMTEKDRVAVYLELIDSYQAMDKAVEATKLMHEALTEFQGSKEEQHLMLLNADLALNRGDVERALTMLKNIGPDQPNYLEARQKMADIYLHHKKDKRQFALCFKEIVEKNPSPQAFVMLGDAYMSIQEPEKAIELYEAALKKNPKDHSLSSKIGKALVKSHNYLKVSWKPFVIQPKEDFSQCFFFFKAVNYYEAALKSGQLNFLRHDLADLLLKLGNFEKCERVLKQGLESASKSGLDIQTMADEVKFQMLLSKVFFETGNWEGAIQTLMLAKENQVRILKRSPSELSDKLNEHKTIAADICNQLGQFYENHRDFSKSVNFYKEALTYSTNDVKIMLSMAHLYLLMGDLDNCHQICQNVLKIDKDNDHATLMLADLMYQKNQSDTALKHFQQLLERNPNQYHAMARAIELAWRMGDLDQAEKYLSRALDNSARASVDAGFNYCKGLLEWYTGDPNAALQHFNRARRDLEWGERSIYNMIEICLNPDNEIIGGEVFDSGEAIDNTTSSDKQDAREMGVRTAERFLKELRYKPGLDYKYRLMENFIMLSTKNKTNIEQVLATFNEMAGGENTEVTNVGTILGLARGYMMLKQTPKAKAQLKRVVGHAWNFEEADYLEQCWLLLADTYINQNKYDVATEILKTCLQYNASCLKALEFLGFIREKEQKWVEAAANYERAWKLSKKRNPTIGYKLAFNYLKSKRYVDAIDTCHRVLQMYPSYPKIKRDVLDKARANLRM